MGRYWYLRTSNEDTNILCDGKFWLGIQSSNDFENLGFTVDKDNVEYTWHGCNCSIMACDMTTYCENCYSSEEDHKEQAADDFEEYGKLYYESNMVPYEASKNNIYDKIVKMIEEYKSKNIDQYFEKCEIAFTIGGNEIEILPEIIVKKNIDNELEEDLARYYLCLICLEVFEQGAEDIFVTCEF